MDTSSLPPAVSHRSDDANWVTLEYSVPIERPAAAIQAAFQVQENYARFFPSSQLVELVAPFPDVGGRVNLKYQVGGMTFDLWVTVLERGDAGAVAQLEIRNVQFVTKAVLAGRITWLWQAEEAGTRLTGRFEYEIQPSAFGRQMERWVLRRLNEENLERAVKNIKRVVEIDGTH